ncbi:DUF420 domain-containing protein [Parapedobacter sp. ISTM3]|uniref:DUF420 domain-containing protein n=1 Tax=Parapedobacter sp. ISTM3 TaxID=2800130 RepID=UPI001907AEE7|nr:DUF420 domain-containing protein [Parapedobacter sp. ISTM3]MBK1439328.1 DUF420 domain-containing protein [Parapedobacter sp. ISTM3]
MKNIDYKIDDKLNYRPWVWGLTIGINSLIALAFFLPNMEKLRHYDFSYLPKVNAVLNSLTFIALLLSLLAIKNKKITLHRNLVFLAFGFTSIFLVTYLVYHFSTPSAQYGGEGIIRYIYFFVLITHIVLAALIVPLALISIGRGLNMEVTTHRRIARWTMPIWLYVSLTGVVVYFMIAPYY